MSLDLKLLPLLGPHGLWVSHSMIDLLRREELWPAIQALSNVARIPEPLNCHLARDAEDENIIYGEVTEDAFGDPLTWTTVADLLTVRDHEHVQGNWQNRAAWAYLAEMPLDWKIVLYWS
jgi:hypothetical protein